MPNIRGKLRKLTRFQQMLIGLACLLAVLVAYSYLDFSKTRLPLPGQIQDMEEKSRAAMEQLAELEWQRSRQESNLRYLQELAEPFLWRIDNRDPSSEIQSALERIARAERVTIRSMGSPRISEISEHIKKVEIAITLNGSMREVTRFMTGVEKAPRKLYWNVCSLRPTQNPGNESINLNGRIEAFFLIPSAERFIFEAERDL